MGRSGFAADGCGCCISWLILLLQKDLDQDQDLDQDPDLDPDLDPDPDLGPDPDLDLDLDLSPKEKLFLPLLIRFAPKLNRA